MNVRNRLFQGGVERQGEFVCRPSEEGENGYLSILGTNAVTGTDVLNFDVAASGTPYSGLLDNIAVYDFVLTLEDIQARCEADAGTGNCP